MSRLSTGEPHYNYYRDYDPSLGRYIESDPAGIKAGLSMFAYVKSVPLSRSDAMGLWDDGKDGGDNGGYGGTNTPCTLVGQWPYSDWFVEWGLDYGGHPRPRFMFIWTCVYRCTSYCPPNTWLIYRNIPALVTVGCPATHPPGPPLK